MQNSSSLPRSIVGGPSRHRDEGIASHAPPLLGRSSTPGSVGRGVYHADPRSIGSLHRELESDTLRQRIQALELQLESERQQKNFMETKSEKLLRLHDGLLNELDQEREIAVSLRRLIDDKDAENSDFRARCEDLEGLVKTLAVASAGAVAGRAPSPDESSPSPAPFAGTRHAQEGPTTQSYHSSRGDSIPHEWSQISSPPQQPPLPVRSRTVGMRAAAAPHIYTPTPKKAEQAEADHSANATDRLLVIAEKDDSIRCVVVGSAASIGIQVSVETEPFACQCDLPTAPAPSSQVHRSRPGSPTPSSASERPMSEADAEERSVAGRKDLVATGFVVDRTSSGVHKESSPLHPCSAETLSPLRRLVIELAEPSQEDEKCNEKLIRRLQKELRGTREILHELAGERASLQAKVAELETRCDRSRSLQRCRSVSDVSAARRPLSRGPSPKSSPKVSRQHSKVSEGKHAGAPHQTSPTPNQHAKEVAPRFAATEPPSLLPTATPSSTSTKPRPLKQRPQPSSTQHSTNSSFRK